MKVIFQDFDFIGGAWIREPNDQLYLILGTEVVTGSESTTYEIHDFRIHGANYFSWYDESILLIFFFLVMKYTLIPFQQFCVVLQTRRSIFSFCDFFFFTYNNHKLTVPTQKCLQLQERGDLHFN